MQVRVQLDFGRLGELPAPLGLIRDSCSTVINGLYLDVLGSAATSRARRSTAFSLSVGEREVAPALRAHVDRFERLHNTDEHPANVLADDRALRPVPVGLISARIVSLCVTWSTPRRSVATITAPDFLCSRKRKLVS